MYIYICVLYEFLLIILQYRRLIDLLKNSNGFFYSVFKALFEGVTSRTKDYIDKDEESHKHGFFNFVDEIERPIIFPN